MSVIEGDDPGGNETVKWVRDAQNALSLHGKIEEGWVACFCKETGYYYPCKSAENKLADMKEIRIMKSLKGKEDIGIKVVFREEKKACKPRSIDVDYEKKRDISGLENGWDAYVRKGTKEYYVCKSFVNKQYDEKQIEIMKRLKGKENIGIKDVYGEKDCVKILMEPCVGESLTARIGSTKKHFWREAAKLTKIIVKVIKTCHLSRVTLGNLKETFIFANKNDDSSLKAVYFGSADISAEKDIEKKQRKDIWLAGEVLYLLLTGEKKLAEGEIKNIKQNKVKSPEWLKLPEGVKSLIQKMLGDEPLTTEQVLDNEWICTNGAGDVTLVQTAVRKLEQIKIGERGTKRNR